MTPQQIRRELTVTTFSAFLNFLGLTIAFPIVTPLCMPGGGFFPLDTPKTVCTAFLGILLGLFPLVQFFTAPILGSLSDRYGRKPILLFSIIGMTLGSALFALSISISSLWLALASRIIQGGLSGSLAVLQSTLSDLSDEKTKTRNFGLFGAAFGASLFLGPALGGFLSDKTLVPWFSLATPIWFAAILGVLNYFQVQFTFNESLPQDRRKHSRSHLLTGPINVFKAFTNPATRKLFSTAFLLAFGFNFFTQFFQYFLIERHNVTQFQIGALFAYIGLFSILVQAIGVRYISKVFRPSQVLRWTLLLLPFVFPLIMLMPSYGWLYAVVFLNPMLNGVSIPNITTLVSSLADNRSQGEILGINQSVQAVAQFIPPLLGGAIVGLHYTLPLWISSAFIFLAWVVFMWPGRKTAPATAQT
jgi:DHA1 family tetracycline resistance protein-like MFS transporter